jgi:aquaporin Z
MRIRSFAYLHWHALKLASIAMKKFLMEFIGTFFLYFIIASMLLDPARAALAPLAVGIGLMALVYMGGHISRAHYNPAVTLAFYLRGQCEKKDIPGYIFAQLAGAILASWIVPLIQGGPEVTTWEVGGAPGLLAEFFGTYMLVLVILNVATVKGYEGNQYYGVAIGATVMAMAYAVGAYSGGSFNPAVTLGMILSGFLNSGDLWFHLLGQFLAAIAATSAFFAMTRETRRPAKGRPRNRRPRSRSRGKPKPRP